MGTGREIEGDEMKEWTREEVERLVPERHLRIDGMDLAFNGKPFPRDWLDAFFQTRLGLETANKALSLVKDCSLNPAHTMRMGGLEQCLDACHKIAREALKEKP